ncbi:hypothetical protein EMPS_06141 [Entomortierella parvispora]|uniref:Uncharacterized protein n=1 Tax=Entomortierella parvispora TaxID=205924 RepID=A0A9P3HC69_9FUNG|nr:hypothetical protein EMPS_06141 [Entomortierella parvispora]
MRPDPHKQAASRKYHNKVRGRGGSVAGSNSEASAAGRGGRGGAGAGRGRGGGREGYRGHSGNIQENDDEDENEDGTPRKSYARRKITSNADRYLEREDEVTESEELEQGIDRQTLAFKELLKDSDQKQTFDPAAYFRFKSEKEVEVQDPLENSQQARKLLEVRLNDIEEALMTLSIKDRLFLRESDARALDEDLVGKVSLSKGKPIVPKLVRGEAAADILIKPSGPTPTTGVQRNVTLMDSYSKAAMVEAAGSKITDQASLDADLDDLLDITKSYGKSRSGPSRPTNNQESSELGRKPRLPPPSKGKTPPAQPKGPLPGGPKKGSGKGANDAEWLDSILGI